ncbi:hypothetical protein [Lederbergia galactosidilytica]|uniref:Uncharacterized protein n=1 Tax=Lederbergia galactosidilytica TaxID=217031 RepID=A0A177ZR76_9BACI|nr:hypothetical protein [Lederbergia galactosidilytica]OAK70103.1 hypothetical protein ABB05_13065 [Lederbergia galactosidilytica]
MTIEIGILFSAMSLILAILGYQLSKTNQQIKRQQLDRQEIKSDTEASVEVKAELGYIRKGVDDIRIDLKANEKNIGILTERVTRVEESAKQAHKRIDNYEGGH